MEELNNLEPNLDRSDEKLHLSVVSCSVCGGQDILHEEKQGIGLPPKNWVRKRGDNRKISWSGTWDVWTCKGCGETWRELRR
jgi:hypothetical protein